MIICSDENTIQVFNPSLPSIGNQFSNEIFFNIFEYLSTRSLQHTSHVNRRWRNLSHFILTQRCKSELREIARSICQNIHFLLDTDQIKKISETANTLEIFYPIHPEKFLSLIQTKKEELINIAFPDFRTELDVFHEKYEVLQKKKDWLQQYQYLICFRSFGLKSKYKTAFWYNTACKTVSFELAKCGEYDKMLDLFPYELFKGFKHDYEDDLVLPISHYLDSVKAYRPLVKYWLNLYASFPPEAYLSLLSDFVRNKDEFLLMTKLAVELIQDPVRLSIVLLGLISSFLDFHAKFINWKKVEKYSDLELKTGKNVLSIIKPIFFSIPQNISFDKSEEIRKILQIIEELSTTLLDKISVEIGKRKLIEE